MSNNHIPVITRDLIIKATNEGVSITNICDKYNVHAGTVMAVRKELGLVTKRRVLTEKERESIRKDTRTIKAIAVANGISTCTVTALRAKPTPQPKFNHLLTRKW